MKHGARIVSHLRRFGFAGEVWGVNPRPDGLEQQHGVPVVASLEWMPTPDVVVAAVPAPAVPGVVEQAAKVGAGAVMVLASGFAETGPAGSELQRRTTALAKAHGLRLLGPNSAGIIDAGQGLVLSFLTCLDRPADQVRSGPVALLSQSGGTASLIHNAASARGSGLAVSVSTGNEADVGVGELLDAVLAREDVRAVALLLETVRDGDAFVAAARRALELGKPLVACKVGRTGAGAEVMATHTGAMATPWRRMEAAFRSLGITVAETPDELLEVSELMGATTVPTSDSAGVVTHSGGTAILLADGLTAAGVPLPPVSPRLRRDLTPYLQSGAPKNPADLGGILTGPERFGEAVRLFVDDPDLGTVVAVSTPHPPDHTVARAEDLVALTRSSPKPVVHLWLAGDLGAPGLEVLRRAGVPVSTDVRAVVTAVAGLAHLARVHADGHPPEPHASIPALPGRELDEATVKGWLRELGLATLPSIATTDHDVAVEAARRIGYPVVVKLLSGEVRHKSDLGGVHLDLRDDAGVVAACRAVDGAAHAAGLTGAGYLVEAFRPGVEMIVGLLQDPTFGPLVLVGTGGVQAELYDDVALGLAPMTPSEAARLVASLRGRALLRGFRGAPPADEGALATMVSELSRWAIAAVGVVDEIDLNPVVHGAEGWRLADAVVVVAR